MYLKIVRDVFDRVAKKQELSTTKYHQVIDQIADEIKQAITNLQSAGHTSDVDHKSAIEHLRDKLDAYSLQEQLKTLRKDLYPEILGKIVETDISKASRNMEFDSHIVNQIILNLLYHEGLFDVADIFINETQEPDITSLRSQFSEMHRILDALKAKNLEPALKWVSVNRQKLNQTGSNLEFDLGRLQFLDLLKENESEAVRFARSYVSTIASNHRNKFSSLMGCLLWSGKLESSPYADLLSPEIWAAASHEFMVQFCGSIGMSFKNPLAVTVEAGAQGLPALMKMANIMTREEWEAKRQVPVAMELGREFQFHSAFVCPVSWEQSNEDNPPMMVYECGHVLCRRTISSLTKNGMQHFECPFCPDEMSVAKCRRLYF